MLGTFLGGLTGAMVLVRPEGRPLYSLLLRRRVPLASKESEVRRYGACKSCGIILPPTSEG
jgi:hypothetical protein